MNPQTKKRIKNAVANLAFSLFIFYILFGIFFFFFQKSFIYYPDETDFETCSNFKNYQKIIFEETRFYFLNQSQDVIIYYHGNYGSACDRGLLKSSFESTNKSIIFVEFTGYSNDVTKPNKEELLKNAQEMHTFIEQNNFENVLVYGQSIGTGPATYHASLGNVNTLILTSPFNSFTELVQSKIKIYPQFIITEKYDNQKSLENFQGKVIILSGEKDTIIPQEHSQKLFENLNTKNKTFYSISQADHNTLWYSAEFIETIKKEIQ